MTARELYKFIEDIEWRYDDNNGIEDVIIFPYTFQVGEFNKLLSNCVFDDGGIECKMMDGYFAFWMKDICEYHGIELNEVFKKQQYVDKNNKRNRIY